MYFLGGKMFWSRNKIVIFMWWEYVVNKFIIFILFVVNFIILLSISKMFLYLLEIFCNVFLFGIFWINVIELIVFFIWLNSGCYILYV